MKDKTSHLIYEAYLNESVTVYVRDYEYNREPETVLDLIHSIYPRLEKTRWWLEGGRDWLGSAAFSPDGMDWDKQEGTINFYPPDTLPKELAPELVADVAKIIEGLGSRVIDYSKSPEQSGSTGGDVYRWKVHIPPAKHDDPETMQLSNRNAYEVLHNVLDVDYREGPFELIDARTIILKIEAFLDDIDINAGVIEPSDEKGERGARMIDPGLNKADISGRIRQLHKMATWALNNGYTKLGAH